MKRMNYFFILIVLIIPFSVTHAFAQISYTDAYLEELEDIEDSKYRASAITIIRNSNGELISLTKTDATKYLPNPILDEFLNSNPEYLVKQGKINDQNFSLYNIKVQYDNPKCSVEMFVGNPGFNGECDWYHRAFATILGVTDNDGIEHILFRGLNHAEIIKSEYEVTMFWNVITRD